VILTEQDLIVMEDMFGVGSMAFVMSTNNLFIKSPKGWLEIPVNQ